MFQRWCGAVKNLVSGMSIQNSKIGKPYSPYGDEFGLTIIPDYVQRNEMLALRTGYLDVYTHRSNSIVLSDGRMQVPPIRDGYFLPLVQRIEKEGIVPDGWLNNQTVNLYEPGDFIRAHIDNLFVYDDIFVVVSVGANALLRFVHIQNGEELDVVIPGGSIYIMSGPARYVYFHMVLPVEAQRFSLVLRRSIFNSEGSFRRINNPLGDMLPYRATQILHTLYSKQVGGVRVTVDDAFLESEDIGAFDTSKWVKRSHPMNHWSLQQQLDEDNARIAELTEKRYLNVDFTWRINELKEYYTAIESALISVAERTNEGTP